MSYKPRKNSFYKAANIALVVLAVSVCLGLLAKHNYIFDLLSHFQYQYALGSLILGLAFAFYKKWSQIIICIVLGVTSFYQIFIAYDYVSPTDISKQQSVKIIQYNRNYRITDHQKLIDFINFEKPDVIVVQEATQSHSDALKTIESQYPYQIHEPRVNAFGMVAISKYPFIKQSVKKFDRITLDNIQIHLQIQPDGFSPISIYAIHPPPPTSAALQAQRNMELQITTQDIVNDISPNIIMMGDWNITPFSPYFKDVINNGNLKNEFTSAIPFTTWPMHFIFPFFQLPIDHVIHKGDLILIDKRRAPSYYSDHYPVIAEFSEKP